MTRSGLGTGLGYRRARRSGASPSSRKRRYSLRHNLRHRPSAPRPTRSCGRLPDQERRAVTDLTWDDFEILENGAPQIEQFERVVIRGAIP